MEFAFKYEMWELLRHEKFPETHILAILLTGNDLLFNGKKDIRYQFQNYQESTSYFRISRFLEVCDAQVFKTKNSEISY